MLSRKTLKYFDFDELFNHTVLNNMEIIRLHANQVDLDFYDEYIYNQDILKNPEYAIAISQAFICDFFNNKHNYRYIDFLNMAGETTSDDPGFDDADGFIIGIPREKRIYQIGLPQANTFNHITVYPHEFAHYLHLKYAPKMIDDYLLKEVPSILMQNIFVEYCLSHGYFAEINDLEYNNIYSSVANFLCSKDSFLRYIDVKEELLGTYEDINLFYDDCLYYFGYCYANRLYQLYLEDENKMKRKINGLFDGTKLEDLLKYYNINMRDEQTIDTTLELIKRIK